MCLSTECIFLIFKLKVVSFNTCDFSNLLIPLCEIFLFVRFEWLWMSTIAFSIFSHIYLCGRGLLLLFSSSLFLFHKSFFKRLFTGCFWMLTLLHGRGSRRWDLSSLVSLMRRFCSRTEREVFKGSRSTFLRRGRKLLRDGHFLTWWACTASLAQCVDIARPSDLLGRSPCCLGVGCRWNYRVYKGSR